MNSTTLALLVALAVALAGWLWAMGRMRRGNHRRQRVAGLGEADAERLLAAHGYEVVERQAHRWWGLHIDGAEVEVASRADLLVERAGRRFVADVKTGERATDPASPATRRQLLEYRLVYDVDGVLLVDPARARIVDVDFASLVVT